jgi:PhoH-like ATPase
MAQEKMYVLDTSVLLEDANVVHAFPHQHIGIPIMVLEELDRIKSEPSYRGRNAREVIRIFDALRGQGSLRDGVALDNGATLQVLVPQQNGKTYTLGQSGQDVDNMILGTALMMRDQGWDVELLSKDINLRVKADVMGVKSADYKADIVNEQTVYKGYTTLEVSPTQLRKDMPDDLREAHKQHPFTPNEFVMLHSGSNMYNVRLFRYIGNNQFKPVEGVDLKWSLQPRNIQQRMALDLLFDPDIKLVTLIGPAGTGKTFLALVAALHEVLIKEAYEKILVTRPIVPLGHDIGYLPGDVREKIQMWMQPIYDNMDYIVHAAHASERQMGVYHDEGFEHRKGKHRRQDGSLPTLDELINAHRVSMEAITYMRGRSIPYQFIIIDEVQNLTPHEVKTLISRVGEGSKVVLTGDQYQIDAHHLDFSNNGLVVTSERFKGQHLFGTMFLETTERSELSRLAAQLL